MSDNEQVGGTSGASTRSLVERLRSREWGDRNHRQLRDEAADEIERLRSELLVALEKLVRIYVRARQAEGQPKAKAAV